MLSLSVLFIPNLNFSNCNMESIGAPKEANVYVSYESILGNMCHSIQLLGQIDIVGLHWF